MSCLLNPPLFIHRVEYVTSAAATADVPLGTEQTHVVPVKAPLPLWWQPAHHYKMSHSPVCLQNSTKLRACWLKKGFVCLYLLVFCSCVFIVGTPVNSPSVQFMRGILSTPWCRQKQQSALKIGKNWRVLNQPAGLRWAFLFYKHDCCNFDVPIILSQFLLTIFHQDILFTAQTETLNLLGPEWSVLVLVSGGGACFHHN